MKTMKQIEIKTHATSGRSFARVCLSACKRLLAQIQKTKDAIFNEFRKSRAAHDRLLQLALTEAEALAWQTEYPHLVFPVLAREKAEAVVAWQTHQHSIRQTNPVLALAA
jgi:hypothetical protein